MYLLNLDVLFMRTLPGGWCPLIRTALPYRLMSNRRRESHTSTEMSARSSYESNTHHVPSKSMSSCAALWTAVYRRIGRRARRLSLDLREQ